MDFDGLKAESHSPAPVSAPPVLAFSRLSMDNQEKSFEVFKHEMDAKCLSS